MTVIKQMFLHVLLPHHKKHLIYLVLKLTAKIFANLSGMCSITTNQIE